MSAAAIPIAAAGVTGGSSIISSAMSNSAQKNIAQMNNQFNERMLQKQLDYNTEMYNKQLGDQWHFYNDAKQNQWDLIDYNSAENQRSRLESAGLNPYLMMNGGSAGSAQSSLGTPSSPGVQGISTPTATPYTANFDGFAEAAGRAMDIVTKLAEQKKIKAEAEQVQIENKYRAQKLISEINNTLSTTKNEKEKVYIQRFLAQTQKDLASAQISQSEQNIAESKVRMNFQAQEILYRQKELQFLPIAQKLQVSSQLADIALKQKQGQLSSVQAEHEVKKIAETIASTESKNIKNSSDKEFMNVERSLGVASPIGKGLFSILKQLIK